MPYLAWESKKVGDIRENTRIRRELSWNNTYTKKQEGTSPFYRHSKWTWFFQAKCKHSYEEPENGYIEVDSKGFIELAESGKKIAELIYERHTFLSAWLENIGVNPKIAAEDACRMEHIISAESFEAIKKYVNSYNSWALIYL